MDALAQLKEKARQGWVVYTPFETITGVAAPRLVTCARVAQGQRVLDVACGTGVVALTAARVGADVTGLDLTPELIERACAHAALLGASSRTVPLALRFEVGDVEQLPYADAAFDVVLSQYGHMFAPRPDVAIREMLRVLKPGGTLAFSTWPPELFTGRMFALVARHGPPPLLALPSPGEWGTPAVVQARLGEAIDALTFDRAMLPMPMLSPAHGRVFLEATVGVMARLVAALAAEPEKLLAFRRELEALLGEYFEPNSLHMDYLLTRARKR